MHLRDIIPQHKSDFERTAKLKEIDKEIIRLIIPELFVWLQDYNWPVSPEVRDILLPLNKELVPHIRYILRTNDGDWKHFLLKELVSRLPKETIAELKQDLLEIAHNPSESDKASDVDETAKEILNMIN